MKLYIEEKYIARVNSWRQDGEEKDGEKSGEGAWECWGVRRKGYRRVGRRSKSSRGAARSCGGGKWAMVGERRRDSFVRDRRRSSWSERTVRDCCGLGRWAPLGGNETQPSPSFPLLTLLRENHSTPLYFATCRFGIHAEGGPERIAPLPFDPFVSNVRRFRDFAIRPIPFFRKLRWNPFFFFLSFSYFIHR